MKVLLVEAELPLAEGVSAFLRAQGHEVFRLEGGGAADAALQAEAFDFALVAVELPGCGGFEVVRRIRARGQGLSVILMSADDAVSDRVHGLDCGADDVLAKPFQFAELAARMRAVVRRGGHRHSPVIAFGALVMDVEGRLAMLDRQPVMLSVREWDVLVALVRAGGRTVPKDTLRGQGRGNAVEVCVSRLRPALEAAGLYIRTVRGFGYRLELARTGAGATGQAAACQ